MSPRNIPGQFSERDPKAITCKKFGSNRDGPTLTWFLNLLNNSINLFSQLIDDFVVKFSSPTHFGLTTNHLFFVAKKKSENPPIARPSFHQQVYQDSKHRGVTPQQLHFAIAYPRSFTCMQFRRWVSDIRVIPNNSHSANQVGRQFCKDCHIVVSNRHDSTCPPVPAKSPQFHGSKYIDRAHTIIGRPQTFTLFWLVSARIRPCPQ